MTNHGVSEVGRGVGSDPARSKSRRATDGRPLIGDADLVQVRTGEILSVVGTFARETVRARVSYLPDRHGHVAVDGQSYRKTSYDAGIAIAGSEKVLDLAGEQQFLIDRADIVKHWPTSGGVAERHLPEQHRRALHAIRDRLFDRPGLEAWALGATGTLLLGATTETSDLDLVVTSPSPSDVLSLLESVPGARHRPTFTWNHVLRKYRSGYGQSPESLRALFETRRSYFEICSVGVSIRFVNPEGRADDLLAADSRSEYRLIQGHVQSGDDCLFAPRVVRVVSAGLEQVTLLSWLFLHGGGLDTGALVEAHGRVVSIAKLGDVLDVSPPGAWLRRLA